ncbi:hypothetical protein [Dongia sp.]|uniref:hypothetical protein n=1 Tax=Dongia sp. TaxID=1977262 RepID=UPI00375301F1
MKAFFFAVAAFGALALAGPSALAGEQDFSLINATGYEISELYVAPTQSADWQEDVLGQDTLADSQQANISFSRDTDTCAWDLKVVYSDDNTSAEWHGVDLCQLSVVTIKYDADSGETSAYGQ